MSSREGIQPEYLGDIALEGESAGRELVHQLFVVARLVFDLLEDGIETDEVSGTPAACRGSFRAIRVPGGGLTEHYLSGSPEIDVDEVMRRVEEKVKARPPAQKQRAPLALDAGPPTDWSPVDHALERARQFSQVGAALPPMDRIHGLRRLVAVPLARGFLRIAQLFTRDQRSFNQAVIDTTRGLYERLKEDAGRLARVATRLASEVAAGENDLRSLQSDLSSDVSEVLARTANLEQRLGLEESVGAGLRGELEALRGELEALRGELARLPALADEARRDLAARLEAQVQGLASRLQVSLAAQASEQAAISRKVAEQLERLQADVAELGVAQRLNAMETRVGALSKQVADDRHSGGLTSGQLRAAIAQQERRLSLLLEEARRRLPQPLDASQLKVFADEEARMGSAIYLDFENHFRGSREDIKGRVAVYLPRIRAANAGSEQAPLLDIGCGRGELLEVLRSEGLKARGVDMNRDAVEQCRALKLDVTRADAFEALSAIPDGSLGALTAIHVVEHIPFAGLLRLIDEAVRVLRPGGLVIFETPNPRNVLVGSCTFYCDPTHRSPLPPETLHYLMEARGLVRLETLPLHPFPPEMRIPEDGSALARVFNEYFYGPQDYAVVGRRP